MAEGGHVLSKADGGNLEGDLFSSLCIKCLLLSSSRHDKKLAKSLVKTASYTTKYNAEHWMSNY